MAQDHLEKFATVACQCSTWMLSIGRISEGLPEGIAQLMLLCGGCNSQFTLNLTMLGAPRKELLKALALASRSMSREQLHQLVDEAVVKDVMES